MRLCECSEECAIETDFFVDVFKTTPCYLVTNIHMLLLAVYVNY